MIKVKFDVRNPRGEQVQAPTVLEVEDVPHNGDTVGLFGLRGVVESVERLCERGNTRSGVSQQITVTMRTGLLDTLKQSAVNA
ncbi:hypothetical protein HFO56_23000 [Rhizobium laguerreae]|uniref:hypothetical protein n=1 Tax=Rhizobium laguerreae TaxID=1076926 RepID=UPI001C904A8E|nr:hypothetical protein [Rhizobium laguerreae]MBY3155193.1 hypothetical protein [Rhizobium laguerreae]